MELVRKCVLIMVVVVALGGQQADAKISCYSGISTNYTNPTTCNFCESITYYYNGLTYTLGACNATSSTCPSGTRTVDGYQENTTCCYTDNCNTLTAPVPSTVSCYNGAYSNNSLITECHSCETKQYTSNDVLNYVGVCLSGTCTAGSTTYDGYDAIASCCYYDGCNPVSAPVSGPTVPTTFECYKKSPETSAITTSSAVCTSCQTIYATIEGVNYTSKACCEATSYCKAGTYSYEGSSGTSYLCYSNLCNGSSGSSGSSGSRSLRHDGHWLIYAMMVVLSGGVQLMNSL